jgi:hypothetical protein
MQRNWSLGERESVNGTYRITDEGAHPHAENTLSHRTAIQDIIEGSLNSVSEISLEVSRVSSRLEHERHVG